MGLESQDGGYRSACIERGHQLADAVDQDVAIMDSRCGRRSRRLDFDEDCPMFIATNAVIWLRRERENRGAPWTPYRLLELRPSGRKRRSPALHDGRGEEGAFFGEL